MTDLIFEELKEAMEGDIQSLEKSFSKVRTGRASVTLLDGIKVDYYDPKEKVIHEVKKSNKFEKAHEWQLKYYIYVFGENGIEGVTGLLEYPKMRNTTTIFLSNRDKEEIEAIKKEIAHIVSLSKPPQRIKKSLCKNCSYHDFCWIDE